MPLSSGEFVRHLDLTRPTLSVHFNKLKQAELGAVERHGTSLIYSLNTSILEEALTVLLILKDDGT